jgi:hypothetical protein
VPPASAVLLAADSRAIVPAQSALVAVRRADDQGLIIDPDNRRFARCVAGLSRVAVVTPHRAVVFRVS